MHEQNTRLAVNSQLQQELLLYSVKLGCHKFSEASKNNVRFNRNTVEAGYYDLSGPDRMIQLTDALCLLIRYQRDSNY